ncbi:hypothetical protein CcCBS67573_g09569 [Chytriomyces confervae]|uniref:Uncharacterized protein n=1 Tax=Chytriomyces confervae TaxID=246404 RepID=A0A507DT98_9FUNG|nr:hypothetical protein CcCBS67573_g09569 [Chytriomyces confervae]
MRKAKATLASCNWTKEQDSLLYNYLKEHEDGNKKGSDIKAAVPGLRAFISSTLNSKIKTIRKLVNDPDADPKQDSLPMGLSSFKSKQLVADEDDNSDDETVLPAPHLAFQECVMTQVKPQLSAQSQTSDTKQKVPRNPLSLMPMFMDEHSGLHHVQIVLRIVTNHQIQYNITADGKQLVYTLKPKTVATRDFVDPDHVTFDYPPNQAIVQYFHNDPGTEEFTYTINLPEAVDSNCVSKRDVLRTVETVDTCGYVVRIQQHVAKALVYMVSGQRSGDHESDWA